MVKTALLKALGPEKIITSRIMRQMYAFDSSPFIHMPDLVVFPESTREVSAILRIARQYGVPVMARGAGTCLSGGAVPVKGGISLVMTRIRDIGKTQGIIIAQMAHAGDGNAHPHLLYYPDEKNIQQRLHDATADIFKAALELGGTISGEHGIGLEKQSFMAMQFSRHVPENIESKD